MKLTTKIQKTNYSKLLAACNIANLNKEETAVLLGNAWVETQFSFYRENLNYSQMGLARTWPSIFKKRPELAEELAHRPIAIANTVYANKLGNGDKATNDGWTYRGLGPMQITGAITYKNIYQMHVLMYKAGLTTAAYPPSPRLYSAANHAEVTAIAYWLAYVRSPKWQLPAITDVKSTDNIRALCYKINKAGLKMDERVATALVVYSTI
jgi:predicted chitinase